MQPGYPAYPAYPVYPTAPPKPPASGADIAVSVVVLILTALFGAVAGFFGIFSLAFIDHCPPATCSIDGAVTSVMMSLGIALLIGVAGLVATIVQLVRRKRGWPIAVGTLVLCVLTVFLGGVGYVMAVGG